MKALMQWLLLAGGLAAMPAARAQSQPTQLGWEWTAAMGRPNPGGGFNPVVLGGTVAATSDAGAAISGWFMDYVALGASPGDTLRGPGLITGMLVKFNAAGQKQWAVAVGGVGATSVGSIAEDSQQRLLCMVGHDATLANPGGGSLPGPGVAWFRYSDTGAFQQAGELGQGSFSPSRITLDAANGFALSGSLRGLANIGPYSVGISGNPNNSYVARFNSAAAPVWVRQLTSTGLGSINSIRGQAVLPNGDVLIGGSFYGDVTLDPTHQFVANGVLGFLACYAGNTGAIRWARTVSVPVRPLVDPASGQAYVAGEFTGTLNFDGVAPVANGTDLFIARLDAATGLGQSLVFARGGAGDQTLSSIVCQAGGAFALNGYGQGGADFGNDLALTAASPTASVQYVLQLNAQGISQTLYEVPASARGASLALDPNSRPFLLTNTGAQPVRFGQLAPVVPRSAGGEVVLAHVGPVVVSATRSGVLPSGRLEVYPNPSQGRSSLQLTSDWHHAQVRLYDALGRPCRTGTLNDGQALVPTAGLAPGLYVVRVQDGDRAVARKMLIE